MLLRRQFSGDILHTVFSASRVQHISDLRPKFALRTHHVWKYGRHQICDGWQYHTTTITVLWPFFRGHPGELVPEENFWTLWCKGRLTIPRRLRIGEEKKKERQKKKPQNKNIMSAFAMQGGHR